jgi:hypothetical protein
MTTKTTAAEIAGPLKAGFPAVTDAEDRRLARRLSQILAEGDPVDDASLASAVGRPESDVSAALARQVFDPLVYRDDRGRIVGFSGLGIAELGETVHRVKVDGGPTSTPGAPAIRSSCQSPSGPRCGSNQAAR